MVFYGALLLLPLFVIIGLLWLFFSARRNKADETGRVEVQHAGKPRTETRAHGRET
jgi:hypothetical protein